LSTNPYTPPTETANTDANVRRYWYAIAAILSACAAIAAAALSIQILLEHYALIRDRGPSNLWDIIFTGLLGLGCSIGFGYASMLWLCRKRWLLASIVTLTSVVILVVAPRLAFHIFYGF
jgi:hypothetical protein